MLREPQHEREEAPHSDSPSWPGAKSAVHTPPHHQIPSRREGFPKQQVVVAQHDTRTRSRIALLFPRIAADVVAVLLPEAGAVLRDELQGPGPFRALPEVEMRHHQAARATVLWLERLAVVLVRQHHVIEHEVLQQQVRRVTAVAVY